MLEWTWIVVRGILYLTFIAIATPVLILLRVDQRAPGIDDGIGYDDDDPGKDLDE